MKRLLKKKRRHVPNDALDDKDDIFYDMADRWPEDQPVVPFYNSLAVGGTQVVEHLLEHLHSQQLAPMLVIPFDRFKNHGRIPHSRENLTMEYEQGMEVIFVSHRWWSVTHPDLQDGKNMKHRIICEGIEKGLEDGLFFNGTETKDAYLWIDYSCIEQDDAEEKRKGIRSLVSYIAKCQVMVIPMNGLFSSAVHLNKNYGERAWCRLETFLFSIVQRTKSPFEPAPSYFIGSRGSTMRAVYTFYEQYRPSYGAVTDSEDIVEIEDIEAEALRLMGFSLIEYALADLKENKNTSIKICKQFLGDVHVEDISRRLLSFSENEKPIVSPRFGLDVRLKIDFTENAIGPNGVRDILALNNTNVFILTELNLSENPIGDKGVMAIANLLKGPACKLEILNLTCLQEAVTIYYPLLPRNQRKPNPLNISTESVNSLADALCVNTSLLELVMADNRIQGPAAKVLCEALKSNSTLSILDLSKNKIGWNGSRQILDMLKKAKDTLSFSQINLSFNDLGSNSIKYINKFNKQYPDNQIICNTPEAESIDFEERWNRDRHKSFTIGRFREI